MGQITEHTIDIDRILSEQDGAPRALRAALLSVVA